MKVIKADEVKEQGPEQNGQIDQKRVAEAQEKFDTIRQLLETKNYAVLLSVEETKYLFENFYETVEWKGYESYAISETYEKLQGIVVDGALNGNTAVEIVEAIFHFLKNYPGKGVENAKMFRRICDQFALPMKEINDDRQTLRDLSLELVAAEQGITVENLVEAAQREQALQQGR